MSSNTSLRLALVSPLLWLACITHAEYLGSGAGYTYLQHTYLPDTAKLQTTYLALDVDLSRYRRSPTGAFARGPIASLQNGQSHQKQQGHVPLYHWHHLHGIWFGYTSMLSQSLAATLSEGHTYLGDNGNSIDVIAQTPVRSTIEQKTYDLYWRSHAQHHGVANLAGIYWHQIATPMSASIEGVEADLFDGTETGWGVLVGRHQDHKGLNFQWQVKLGQNSMQLSRNSLPQSARSRSESRHHYLYISLRWHYRYYLAPYWYTVPYAIQNFSVSNQSKSFPERLKHAPYINSESQVGLTIRRYF